MIMFNFFLLTLLFSVFSINAEVPFYNRFNKEETCNFLKAFLKEGDLVFDVGANTGKKTELYLACGARVVCIEPQSECIQILCSKFDGNKNVYIEQVGLADQEGFLTLFQNSNANTISSFSQEWVAQGRFAQRHFKWDKQIKVKVTTLDKMIEEYGIPQFCKIDVENFEYEVLKGLSQPINYLSFEFNSEFADNTKKCLEYLASLGYKKFNFAPGERGWFLFDQWFSVDDFFEKLQKTAKENDWKDIWGLWGDIYARYEA